MGVKCFLFAGDELLGWADVKMADPSMGVASGMLNPSPAYKAVQLSIQAHLQLDNVLFDAEKLQELDAQFAQLNLNVKTENGDMFHPVGIYIDDFAEEVGEIEIEIELYLLGLPYWEHDFLK
jgi:hypothetical protein